MHPTTMINKHFGMECIWLALLSNTIIFGLQPLLVSVSFIQTNEDTEFFQKKMKVLSLIFLKIIQVYDNPYVIQIKQPHLDLYVPQPATAQSALSAKK
ncbi:hypothetical protein MtrunA17_Chr5g0426771 [Medicago truncatula]|uniref:Transmembrane protein n=1 Tax=Medicago truncatula TaxID=3880 RepID=A0A396HS80_MEDTR|nr:hypothetical protein MtrunA17_Chr5g0426771 [Medicago truncatula]